MDLGEDDFEAVWIQDETVDCQVGGLEVILEDEGLDSPTFTADDVLELNNEYDDEDIEMAWGPDHVEEDCADEHHQFSRPPTSSYDPSALLCGSHGTNLASPILKSKISTSILGSIPPSPSRKSTWKGGKLRLSSLKVFFIQVACIRGLIVVDDQVSQDLSTNPQDTSHSIFVCPISEGWMWSLIYFPLFLLHKR
ncbi:hypothetical protein DL96DRAFT_1558096 [Flagelloscypha sp. PMI_526]|nr:hypothetical protein DL96DRAFT_1558096 [Flagelloscypha sp. PMI_526]